MSYLFLDLFHNRVFGPWETKVNKLSLKMLLNAVYLSAITLWDLRFHFVSILRLILSIILILFSTFIIVLVSWLNRKMPPQYIAQFWPIKCENLILILFPNYSNANQKFWALAHHHFKMFQSKCWYCRHA